MQKDLIDSHDVIKWGFYKRWIILLSGAKEKVEIQRYYNKKSKTTISLLPEHIIPYHIYSIHIIFHILQILFCYEQLSQYEFLDMMTEGYLETVIANISFAHIYSFKLLLEKAMHKFSALTKKQFTNLKDFFEYCNNKKFKARKGPIVAKEQFHTDTGHFLYGNASQFR